MAKRTKIPNKLRIDVLTEAGYRCAVPTCRGIIVIDMHHIVPVAEDGPNELANLLALCPTCHALFTRGEIRQESIHVWKSTLVALTAAFDSDAIDNLMFLHGLSRGDLNVSGDGVLHFSRLIGAGFAAFRILSRNGELELYEVGLTEKGKAFVDAWARGDRLVLQTAEALPA